MRILGFILIIVGIVGLLIGGIPYSRRHDTMQVGPMRASVEQRKMVPIPPVVGGLVVVAGIALLFVGSRRRA